MFDQFDAEKLVDLADEENNGGTAVREAYAWHNCPLRHTHTVNGVRIQQVHQTDGGILSQAARGIASLLVKR